MAELKPCPFCGREVKIEEYTVDEPVTFFECGFEVGCPNCHVVFREHTGRLPGFDVETDTKAKTRLIERWNGRAGETDG